MLMPLRDDAEDIAAQLHALLDALEETRIAVAAFLDVLGFIARFLALYCLCPAPLSIGLRSFPSGPSLSLDRINLGQLTSNPLIKFLDGRFAPFIPDPVQVSGNLRLVQTEFPRNQILRPAAKILLSNLAAPIQEAELFLFASTSDPVATFSCHGRVAHLMGCSFESAGNAG